MTELCHIVCVSAESAVQRDSKQVQVDLQDLGYETSGRSENEAERENASSPGTKHTLFTTYSIPYIHHITHNILQS